MAKRVPGWIHESVTLEGGLTIDSYRPGPDVQADIRQVFEAFGLLEKPTMQWKFHHPRMTRDHLGYIPQFLSPADPRPATEQIRTGYIGGWAPFPGFKLRESDRALMYPGDPPTMLLAETQLRDERIYFYEHSWLRIEQPDGTWEVARLD